MTLRRPQLARLALALLVPPLVLGAVALGLDRQRAAADPFTACTHGGRAAEAQVSCIGHHLRVVAKRGDGGDAAAIRALDTAAASDRRVAADCHLAAHLLGEPSGQRAAAAGAEFPVLHGGTTCRDGYVHGFLVGYLQAAPAGVDLLPAVDAGCAGAQGARDELDCVHGFGHALVRREGNDVARASAACGDLAVAGGAGVPRARLSFECRYGMWMEVAIRDAGAGHAHAAVADNCGAAPADAVTACWAFVPGRVLQLTGSSERARRVCDDAPAGDAADRCRATAKELA